MGARRAPLWSNEEISHSFGRQFADDIIPYLSLPDIGFGMRHFLGRLAGSNSRSIVKTLICGEHDGFDEPWVLETLSEYLAAWYEMETTLHGFAHSTMRERCRDVCLAIEHLGTLADRRYPALDHDFFRPPYIDDVPTPALGELSWPEFENLPDARRDRVALRLVTAQALSEFNRLYEIFCFGQKLLCSTTDPDTPMGLIRRILEEEIRSWEQTGQSRFERAWDAEFRKVLEPVLTRETWEMADLPGTAKMPLLLSYHDLRSVVIGCIGAGTPIAASVIALFCCETGWNRQTIFDLGRQPNVFRTTRGTKLCSDYFYTQFKGRAGHNVLAHLQRNKPLVGLASDEFESAWRSMRAAVQN